MVPVQSMYRMAVALELATYSAVTPYRIVRDLCHREVNLSVGSGGYGWIALSLAHGSCTVSATAPGVALPPASMQSHVQDDGG